MRILRVIVHKVAKRVLTPSDAYILRWLKWINHAILKKLTRKMRLSECIKQICKQGKLEPYRMIEKLKVGIPSHTFGNAECWMLAASSANDELFRYLWQNASQSHKREFSEGAGIGGNQKIISFILSHSSEKESNALSCNMVRCAIKSNNIETVRSLIDRLTTDDQDYLYGTAAEFGSVEALTLIDELLTHAAAKDPMYRERKNALVIAAATGNIECMEKLLSWGATFGDLTQWELLRYPLVTTKYLYEHEILPIDPNIAIGRMWYEDELRPEIAYYWIGKGATIDKLLYTDEWAPFIFIRTPIVEIARFAKRMGASRRAFDQLIDHVGMATKTKLRSIIDESPLTDRDVDDLLTFV